MKAWPLLMALAAAACARPEAAERAADASGAQDQVQAKPPAAEDVAESAGASLIGKYAPPLKLKTLDGQTIDLAKVYGKRPVYLKFWATWCIPCRQQMPHFENVERTMGRDMQVVAVDAGFNETEEAVRRYRETMGLTMPIVIDDGRLADALHLRVTPQHIVIGRDGRILHVGFLADGKLDAALRRAAAEPGAPYPEAATGVGDRRAGVPALKTLSGEPLAVGGGGQPTVVFFFSPWCETYLKSSRPAMAEACLKAREQVTQLAHEPGARWIGVAAGLWAQPADLRAYQREHALPLPVALDETGAFFRSFRVADVPSFVVLDGQGRVAARTRRAEQAYRAAVELIPHKAGREA